MDGGSSGEGNAAGRRKPVYQAPVIVPLGAMARSVGASCSAGIGVSGGGLGQCRNGGGARGQCTSGNGRTVLFLR